MKTRLLILAVISTFIFVVSGFAQEQVTKEDIDKAMEQIKQASPQQIPAEAVNSAAQKQTIDVPAAKDLNLEEIKGTVKEIAVDGSYITVNDTKIMTSKEFLAYYPVKEGEEVIVTVASADEGMVAVNINPADSSKEEASEEAGQAATEEGVISETNKSNEEQKEEPSEAVTNEEVPSGDASQEVVK